MGFSQQDVVDLLQLSSTSIVSKWERGLVLPSAENLLKLSILYKTLINELYYELGKQYQVELFPKESGFISRNAKSKYVDRGPPS